MNLAHLSRGIVGVWLAGIAATAHAGGSLYICNNQQVKYPGPGTIALNYDGGGILGTRTKAQVDAIVDASIGVWNNIPSSTVAVTRGPDLPVDVTIANYLTYIGNTTDGLNPVVYDHTGAILDALLGVGTKSNAYGFAVSTSSNCQFTEGHAVINGFLSLADGELSIVLAHEIGHMLGMDHSQIDNSQGLAPASYPVMYPQLNRTGLFLHEDDVATISSLYPSATFNNFYGQLNGTFTRADGTPVLGANLWAKESNTGKLYSIVSDFLVQGTGAFRLILPAGTYTLHAEAVQTNFNGASKIGPYSGNYPASLSYQPPLYVNNVAMTPLTMGNATPTQIVIANGCTTASTFRMDGTGLTWGAGGPGAGCALAAPVCVLAVSSKNIIAGGATTLTASCNPIAATLNWTNSGFGTGITSGSVSPGVTTTYSVSGTNAAGTGNIASVTVTVVLPTPNGVRQVSAGGTHSCAVNELGAIRCWGQNNKGQLGDNSVNPRSLPADLAGALLGFANVATGGAHTCALTTGSGVKCWGDNISGQIGDATNTQRNVAVDVNGLNSGVIAIAVGNAHSCALTTNGGVKCWGLNTDGQLGDGSNSNRNVPVDVAGLATGAIAIAAGDRHTCALISAGAVKCWGLNSTGQLGDTTNASRNAPVAVSGLNTGGVMLAAGTGHTCVVMVSGGVKCWGDNARGQIGDGTIFQRNAPVDMSSLTTGVNAVAVGRLHTCALLLTGGVKCWGGNDVGQVGDASIAQRNTPVDVVSLTTGVASVAAASGDHTCVVLAGGQVKCWGDNASGQVGDGTLLAKSSPTRVAGLSFALTQISAGARNTCALAVGGGAKCWGLNTSGQLGDNSTTQRNSAVDVAGLGSGVVTVATGTAHTCAVTATGGVKCWGSNTNGQIGDNSTTQRITPVDVSGLANGVAAIAAGNNHSCALTTGGGVLCWGLNSNGQLGDSSTTQRLVPTAVTGLASGVAAIAAGEHHTCALTTTGGVKCWGLNSTGQLGDNSVAQRTAPVDVSGLLSGVSAIAAGFGHTCALTTAGGVKCWGSNTNGQLGDGSVVQRNTPVDAIGLTSGMAGVAAGNVHSCARTVGGAAKCWGWNQFGQIGDNSNVQRLTAVDVTGLASGVADISARNGYHTCALMLNDDAKCWGFNTGGQAGDNGATDRLAPSAVYGYAPRPILTTSLNPAMPGQSVTMSATIAGNTPNGTVDFVADGNTIAGCSGVAMIGGSANCTAAFSSNGWRNIAAIYSGDALNSRSLGALPAGQFVAAAVSVPGAPLIGGVIPGDGQLTVQFTPPVSDGGAPISGYTTTCGLQIASGAMSPLIVSGLTNGANVQCNVIATNAVGTSANSATVSGTPQAGIVFLGAVSRKIHGTAGAQDLAINTSVPITGAVTVEARAIGAGHTIVFQFNSLVTIAGMLSVVDGASANVPASAMPSGNDVEVSIPALANAKRIAITLTGVNGAMSPPVTSMGFLLGDVNNSRAVEAVDVQSVKARAGQNTNAGNFRFDLSASGIIGAADIAAVKTRAGVSTLP